MKKLLVDVGRCWSVLVAVGRSVGPDISNVGLLGPTKYPIFRGLLVVLDADQQQKNT